MKDTGGPAFPCEFDYSKTSGEGSTGISVRDYFAAKAMQSLVSILGSKPYEEWQTVHWLSLSAYSIADAMLKERKE
jgi:hypothetical protein